MRSLFPNAVTAYSVMIWSKGLSLSAMTEAFIFGTFHYSLPFELYTDHKHSVPLISYKTALKLANDESWLTIQLKEQEEEEARQNVSNHFC